MDPVIQADLQSRITRADVYSAKSVDGFWTFFSELNDGRWLVEYDPVFRKCDGGTLVHGPYGARQFVPDAASLADIGRVVLTPVTVSQADTARVLAALVSAHAVTLPALWSACEAPDALLYGVTYELLDVDADGRHRSGTLGTVERYDSGDLFRLETGDEVPIADVEGRLWPAGGTLDPE